MKNVLKTSGRVVIILAAAAIVVAITLSLSSYLGISAGAAANMTMPIADGATRPIRGNQAGGGMGLASVMTLGKNLLEIGLIVVPFAVVGFIQNRRKLKAARVHKLYA